MDTGGARSSAPARKGDEVSTEVTEDFCVRGYMVMHAARYLEGLLGDAESKRVFADFSPEAQRALDTTKHADWCPVSVFSELTRAIAKTSDGDEEKARELLVACGVFMAQEATNSFLKILMKILTPGLFAKKIPAIWSRDCSQGELVSELSGHKLVCHAYGMTGFDHVPCTAAGFVTFVLQRMGKPVSRTTIHGWSLETPYTDGARFELEWTN